MRRSQIDASTEEAARAGALPDPRLIVGLANWPVSGPDAFSLRADEMTTQQVGLMQEFPARAKRRAEQALAQATLAQARSLSLAEQQMPLARDRARTALAAYGAGADLQPWLEARRDEIELQLENARLLGEQGRAWAALAYLLPHEENTP